MKKYRIELGPKYPTNTEDEKVWRSFSYELQSIVLIIKAGCLIEACEKAEDSFSSLLEMPMITMSAYETMWDSSDEEKGAPGDDIDDD